MSSKKYITLGIAIVLLALGALASEQWFVQNIRDAGTAQEQTSINFTATEGGLALDAMHSLAAAGQISFSGRDFPGLGFFVEEINGIQNSNGYFWILYVNGTSSQTGASETALSAGDVIEWKYEKGY